MTVVGLLGGALVQAAAAVVLTWRWGVWRWLAVLVGLVVLLASQSTGDDRAGWALGAAALAVVVTGLCWRSWPLPGPGALAVPVLGALVVTLLSRVWLLVVVVLALTLVVRRCRRSGVAAPQVDDVDAAALAAHAAKHDRPGLAPVAVVIAAWQEADGLGAVLARLPVEVCGLATSVVVVDDGSTDGTAEVAEAVGGVHVLRCATNRGQGAALRLGYRFARTHGADYVITTDADGQYDVADMPALLAPVLAGEADFVTGSRILGRQHTRDRVRRAGVHLFAWVVTALTGTRVTDTSFGLRAMRVEVTGTVTLNQPQYQSSELLIGVLSHGFRVLEVPGTMHVRNQGISKKGRNLVYGRRYAGVVLGTWWREACPRPVTAAPALRSWDDRRHGVPPG